AFPGALTPAGWRALVEHGVRSVVDLRCPSEKEYDVVPDVQRSPVPVRCFDDEPLEERLRACAGVPEHYSVLVEACRSQLAAAVGAIADAPTGGVLVHCQVGRDRTGIVVALVLALAGVPDEAIVDDYVASEAELRPVFEIPDDAACEPLAIRRVL